MRKTNRYIIRCCGLLLLALFLTYGNNVSAQFLGTSTNYAGSRGLAINPSSMTTSYVFADFGVNVGASVSNDFAYLYAKDYYNLLTGKELSDYYINGNRYDFGFVMNRKPKNVYEAADATVLSAMYNPNGKIAFGVFVNNRVYTSGTQIPWEIMEAAVVGIENGDYIGRQYKSENGKIGLMAWSEVGLSYSMTVFDRSSSKFDAGLTVKGLLGYGGVALNLNHVRKDIIDKNVSMIHSIDMDAAMALPMNYGAKFDGGQVFNMDEPVKGLGLGFDIGFTYTQKQDDKEYQKVERPCTFPKIRYIWRLGVSLLDVGAVKFDKNARVYKIYSYYDEVFDVRTLEGVESFDAMMDTLCSVFYDDVSEADAGNKFTIGLPTALSVQFDYNIWNNFYVNATLVQPFRLKEFSVKRSAQVVLEPRYETTFFDFSVPVTFYNYERLIVGMEARLFFLTVGTQNIMNFLGVGESFGLDIYAAVKFNLYKGRCLKKELKDACWNANFR
jgi:hypothetical protein